MAGFRSGKCILKKWRRRKRNLENGNPRSAAHVQEEEESIGGAAAEKMFYSPSILGGGGRRRAHTRAGPTGGTPSIFGGGGPALEQAPSPHSSRSKPTLEQAPQGGPRVFLEAGGAAVVALDSSRLQNRVFGFWRRRGAIPFRGNLDSSSRFWEEEETGPTLTRASGRFQS